MRVLLIEDDNATAQSIELMLQSEGFNVYTTDLGEEGVDLGKLYDYDIILLDINLPDMSGYDVLKQLRVSKVQTPILILSGLAQIDDKVKGLGFGADDYMTKPFAFEELLARIVALRRRRADLDDAEGELRVGPLALDPESRRVSRDGRPIALTAREFELLRYLMSNADKVVSRERLLNGVWSYGYDPGTKIVDVYVRYLRAKIDVPGEPSLIETVRGVGYMMPSRR